MSYRLRHLLNQLPIAFGQRSDRRLRATRLKHAQFACYLEATGFGHQDTDHHERSLRRRRMAKGVLLWATAFAAAWIALESARALTMF
jgi:hypothetical protein